MSLKDKAKRKAKNKIKKVAFKIIKPFLPFIIVIVGIVFAVCTVVDSLFTTEDDMKVVEQLSNENYQDQYSEWLKEKESSPNAITNNKELISKGMFTWPIPGYTLITSHFGMRNHPLTGVYKLHSRYRCRRATWFNFCCNGKWNSYKSRFQYCLWQYGYNRSSEMVLLLYMHMVVKY